MTNGDGGDSGKAAIPLVSEIVIDRDGRLFVSNLSAEVLEALARAVGEDPSFAAQFQALWRYLALRQAPFGSEPQGRRQGGVSLPNPEQKEKGHAP